MNKIRDLIYDFNDIFVALLIVIVTTGIIVWRVDTIMDYPKYLASKSNEGSVITSVDMTGVDLNPVEVDPTLNDAPEDIAADPNGAEGSGTESGEPAGGTQQGTEGGQAAGETPADGGQGQSSFAGLSEDVKFTIPGGTYAAGVAKLLYQAGLIESEQAFLDELKAVGKEGSVQAGTFTIPAGSSISDIIKIIAR
ncbi:MAG: hypothetical protein II488_02940 [Firmicutes bacterium]|nr:hypothetical protein [Bacillota bacterium]MBQ4371563.1 hypothetical protein [Bacillota bacterium]